MGSCWKQKAKDYLWSVVGEPCGGQGCYSDIVGEMDAIHYYNYPKNGAANSCAILCDNSVLHSCTDPSYDEDPDCAKWTALQCMYEPQNGSNAGAGCVQKIGYFKKAGAWYTDTQDFCELDEIFFADSKYVSSDNPYGVYHTGMIVDWGHVEELGTDGFTTIEGNVNGGVVAYRYYRYDDPRILGAGRPNWDGWSPDESNNDDEKPEPTPEPTPEPIDDTVTVELPVLYKGVDAEGEVLTIQALLNGFGFRDNDGNMLAVDGIFGSNTEQAVKSYQSARGLEVCGVVNAETWNRILK
jgi:peptidoglycan hydrolase-like protein with peptidoglycan-binding domain